MSAADKAYDAVTQIEGPLRNVAARLQLLADLDKRGAEEFSEGAMVVLYDCLDDTTEALEHFKAAFAAAGEAADGSGATAAPEPSAEPAADPGATADAALVERVAAFVATEWNRKQARAHFEMKPDNEWTAEDRAVDEADRASVPGYLAELEEISMAEPTTPEGLAAQAMAMLWHFQDPSGDEAHAWNLAESVLRVLGKPLPSWAA